MESMHGSYAEVYEKRLVGCDLLGVSDELDFCPSDPHSRCSLRRDFWEDLQNNRRKPIEDIMVSLASQKAVETLKTPSQMSSTISNHAAEVSLTKKPFSKGILPL